MPQTAASDVATTPVVSRIDALDWARGWMLVASVSVNSVIIPIPLLAHAAWVGVMPIDLIFPLFVTLAGCGLAFAFRRKVEPGGVVRRALVLTALGLGYNAIVEFTFVLTELRLPGVLQLYAAVIVVMALLHLVTRSWQGWALVTVLFAVAHTATLSLYARSCIGELLTPACNPSGPLDSAIFGASRMYADGLAGHDPEGIIAITGALVSTAAGATVGHLVLSFRALEASSQSRLPITTVPIALAIVGFVVLALALWWGSDLLLGGPVPAMKRLWTAPFALGVAAIAAVLIWLGQIAVPSSRLRTEAHTRVWRPIIALGRNSLLVYFGSHLLMSLLRREWPSGMSITDAYVAAMPTPELAQVSWTLLWLAFWVALARELHRRRWYVKP